MKNESEARPVNIGSSILMVVFILLCLFTLAAISLATAKKDYADSTRNAERVQAYYAASNEAEKMLSAMDESIADGNAPQQLSYTVPISSTQEISVSLQLNTEEGRYDVVEWKTVSTESWTPTSSLPVLQNPTSPAK